MVEASIAIIAASFIGMIIGLLGAGGSILIMPVLVYALGIPASEAITYSLGIVGITSLITAIRSATGNNSQLKAILLPFGIASISATICTRLLILPLLPQAFSINNQSYTLDSLFMILLAFLMLIASRRMLFDYSQDTVSQSTSFPSLISSGLLLGILTGCTGIGGGFLIVPILLLHGGLTMQQAIRSSMILIACNAIPAFGFDVLMLHSTFQLDVFLQLLLFSVGGSFVGIRIARFTQQDMIKKLFGILIAIVALKILLTELT